MIRDIFGIGRIFRTSSEPVNTPLPTQAADEAKDVFEVSEPAAAREPPRPRVAKPTSGVVVAFLVVAETLGLAGSIAAAVLLSPYYAIAAVVCAVALLATSIGSLRQWHLRACLALDDPKNPVVAEALAGLSPAQQRQRARDVRRLLKDVRCSGATASTVAALLPLGNLTLVRSAAQSMGYNAPVDPVALEGLARLNASLAGAERRGPEAMHRGYVRVEEDTGAWLAGAHGRLLTRKLALLEASPDALRGVADLAWASQSVVFRFERERQALDRLLSEAAVAPSWAEFSGLLQFFSTVYLSDDAFDEVVAILLEVPPASYASVADAFVRNRYQLQGFSAAQRATLLPALAQTEGQLAYDLSEAQQAILLLDLERARRAGEPLRVWADGLPAWRHVRLRNHDDTTWALAQRPGTTVEAIGEKLGILRTILRWQWDDVMAAAERSGEGTSVERLRAFVNAWTSVEPGLAPQLRSRLLNNESDDFPDALATAALSRAHLEPVLPQRRATLLRRNHVGMRVATLQTELRDLLRASPRQVSDLAHLRLIITLIQTDASLMPHWRSLQAFPVATQHALLDFLLDFADGRRAAWVASLQQTPAEQVLTQVAAVRNLFAVDPNAGPQNRPTAAALAWMTALTPAQQVLAAQQPATPWPSQPLSQRAALQDLEQHHALPNYVWTPADWDRCRFQNEEEVTWAVARRHLMSEGDIAAILPILRPIPIEAWGATCDMARSAAHAAPQAEQAATMLDLLRCLANATADQRRILADPGHAQFADTLADLAMVDAGGTPATRTQARNALVEALQTSAAQLMELPALRGAADRLSRAPAAAEHVTQLPRLPAALMLTALANLARFSADERSAWLTLLRAEDDKPLVIEAMAELASAGEFAEYGLQDMAGFHEPGVRELVRAVMRGVGRGEGRNDLIAAWNSAATAGTPNALQFNRSIRAPHLPAARDTMSWVLSPLVAQHMSTLSAAERVMFWKGVAAVVSVSGRAQTARLIEQDAAGNAGRLVGAGQVFHRLDRPLSFAGAHKPALVQLLTTEPAFASAMARGLQALAPVIQRWEVHERRAALQALCPPDYFYGRARYEPLTSHAALQQAARAVFDPKARALLQGLTWAATTRDDAAPLPEPSNSTHPWDVWRDRQQRIDALATGPLTPVDGDDIALAWAAMQAGYNELASELARAADATLPELYFFHKARGRSGAADMQALELDETQATLLAIETWNNNGPLPRYLRDALVVRFGADAAQTTISARTAHDALAYCDSLTLTPALDQAFRVALMDALHGADTTLATTVHEAFECTVCGDDCESYVRMPGCEPPENACNPCALRGAEGNHADCQTHAQCASALTRDYLVRIGMTADQATQRMVAPYRQKLREIVRGRFVVNTESALLRGQDVRTTVRPTDIPPLPTDLTTEERTNLRVLLSGLQASRNAAGAGVFRECFECGTQVQKGTACLHMDCATTPTVAGHYWDFEFGRDRGTRYGHNGIAEQRYIPRSGALTDYGFYDGLSAASDIDHVTLGHVRARREDWLRQLGGPVAPDLRYVVNADGEAGVDATAQVDW